MKNRFVRIGAPAIIGALFLVIGWTSNAFAQSPTKPVPPSITYETSSEPDEVL